MAKIEINLTDEQQQHNNEILARLEAERQKLVEETRALQERSREEMKLTRSNKHDRIIG